MAVNRFSLFIIAQVQQQLTSNAQPMHRKQSQRQSRPQENRVNSSFQVINSVIYFPNIKQPSNSPSNDDQRPVQDYNISSEPKGKNFRQECLRRLLQVDPKAALELFNESQWIELQSQWIELQSTRQSNKMKRFRTIFTSELSRQQKAQIFSGIEEEEPRKTKKRLNQENREAIRRFYQSQSRYISKISRQFNISRSTVRNILRQKNEIKE